MFCIPTYSCTQILETLYLQTFHTVHSDVNFWNLFFLFLRCDKYLTISDDQFHGVLLTLLTHYIHRGLKIKFRLCNEAMRTVSSAYLRLLILRPFIITPGISSMEPSIFSPYSEESSGEQTQACRTPFSMQNSSYDLSLTRTFADWE